MEVKLHLLTCDNGLPWKMASGKALDWAWVLYNGDEMLWHQRRVIGRMAPTHGVGLEVFGLVSPDGDVHVEDYGGTDTDIAAVRYARSRTDVPPGLVGCLLYKFDEDIPDDDMVVSAHRPIGVRGRVD